MDVLLIITGSKKPERRIRINRDVVIGRGKSCSFQVLSTEVSRQHCRLILRDGQVFVRDLGSANGTFVNGHRVENRMDCQLHSGAKLEVGPLKISIEYAAVPDGASEASPGGTTVRTGTDQTARSNPAKAIANIPVESAKTVEDEAGSAPDPEVSGIPVTDSASDDDIGMIGGTHDESLEEVDTEDPVRIDENPVFLSETSVSDDAETINFMPSEVSADAGGTGMLADETPATDEPPAKGMKSLFGLFRRAKKDESQPAKSAGELTPAAPVPTGSAADAVEELNNDDLAAFDGDDNEMLAVGDDEDDLAELGSEVDFDDSDVAVAGDSAFLPQESEEGMIESAEDGVEADDRPVDDGFTDFLQQFGN